MNLHLYPCVLIDTSKLLVLCNEKDKTNHCSRNEKRGYLSYCDSGKLLFFIGVTLEQV